LLPTADHPIPVIPSEESALSKLLASGSDIVVSANDVLIRMNQILSDENVKRISATLEHVDQLSGSLSDQRGDLSITLKQLADATGELKHTLLTLNTMANTTNALVRDDLRGVLQQTQKALESVEKVAGATGSLVDENRGAIDRFTSQDLRQIGPTVIELRETLQSLKQLSDKLGTSDSLLLGRDQPKEFKPQ
jgi:phospholipid/cholesterol/gamma-HCH transport system substrate-binding protein